MEGKTEEQRGWDLPQVAPLKQQPWAGAQAVWLREPVAAVLPLQVERNRTRKVRPGFATGSDPTVATWWERQGTGPEAGPPGGACTDEGAGVGSEDSSADSGELPGFLTKHQGSHRPTGCGG